MTQKIPKTAVNATEADTSETDTSDIHRHTPNHDYPCAGTAMKSSAWATYQRDVHVAESIQCANPAESIPTTHKHGLVSQNCTQRANLAEENTEGGQRRPGRPGNDRSGREAKEVQVPHNLNNTTPGSRGRKATIAATTKSQ